MSKLIGATISDADHEFLSSRIVNISKLVRVLIQGYIKEKRISEAYQKAHPIPQPQGIPELAKRLQKV